MCALHARSFEHKNTQTIKHYELVCASIDAKYRFIEQHHYHIPNFIAHAEKRIWCLIWLSINERWIKRKIFIITVITMAITIIIIYEYERAPSHSLSLFLSFPCIRVCVCVLRGVHVFGIVFYWMANGVCLLVRPCPFSYAFTYVWHRLRIQLKLNTNGIGFENEIEIIDKIGNRQNATEI